MASFTLAKEDTFPNGTSVSAYALVGEGRTPASGAPPGSAVASGTVSGGSVTFAGLADSTLYFAYAASPDRYVRFSTPPAASSTGGGGLLAVTAAGSKTGTYAPVIAAARELHTLTLTGGVTFAPTGWDEGAEILIEATQDGAGSHALSIDDGSGATSVEISGDPGATTLVRLLGRTVTDLDVEVPGSGATGPQGPVGATGDAGATGAKGDPGNVSSDDLTEIVLCTQAAYDLLTPDANTLYVVSG